MLDWPRMQCRRYRTKLEDYLSSEGVVPKSDAGLHAHLRACADCREVLEDAQLGGELMREAGAPAVEASEAFVARVMVSIRAEVARRTAPENFWRPLELLASRFAMVATVALVLLAAYIGRGGVSFSPSAPAPAPSEQITANLPLNPNMPGVSPIMPEPPAQPSNPDEVLMSLVGRDNDF